MNLIEMLFFILAVVCAVIAGTICRHWGTGATVGAAIAGFMTPFMFSQITLAANEARFSRTVPGRRRAAAEAEFDRTHSNRRRKQWRFRPEIGKDGSTIVTVFHGDTIPPLRAFYRFTEDSLEPHEITGDEAAKYIKVHPMR